MSGLISIIGFTLAVVSISALAGYLSTLIKPLLNRKQSPKNWSNHYSISDDNL